jgi:hypothetical protein
VCARVALTKHWLAQRPLDASPQHTQSNAMMTTPPHDSMSPAVCSPPHARDARRAPAAAATASAPEAQRTLATSAAAGSPQHALLCSLCYVKCNSLSDLRRHYAGKPHIKRVAAHAAEAATAATYPAAHDYLTAFANRPPRQGAHGGRRPRGPHTHRPPAPAHLSAATSPSSLSAPSTFSSPPSLSQPPTSAAPSFPPAARSTAAASVSVASSSDVRGAAQQPNATLDPPVISTPLISLTPLCPGEVEQALRIENQGELAENKEIRAVRRAAAAAAAAAPMRPRPPTPTYNLQIEQKDVERLTHDPRRPFYCYVCDAECHNSKTLQQHQKSKNHATASAAFQRGLETGTRRMAHYSTQVLDKAADIVGSFNADQMEVQLKAKFRAEVQGLDLDTQRELISAHAFLRSAIQGRSLEGILHELIEATRAGTLLADEAVPGEDDDYVDGDIDDYDDLEDGF